MRNQWSRDRIIRYLLEREAKRLPMTVGGEGVDKLVYEASRRIFGSWRNAIRAAGIAPKRILTWERWSPARILVMIRHLSRRDRPLATDQLEQRYGNLVSAARRHFGSWTKAVLAAGVEPTKLQRVVPWTRERIIEAILTRVLRNESLVARLVEPRSMVEASHRYFDNWAAAVAAAGLDPKLTVSPPRRGKRPLAAKAPVPTTKPRKPQRRWTKEQIIAGLRARVREQKPINPSALEREDSALFCAARRHLGSWRGAVLAAGLDPVAHRRNSDGRTIMTDAGPREQIARPSQANGALRPDQSA